MLPGRLPTKRHGREEFKAGKLFEAREEVSAGLDRMTPPRASRTTPTHTSHKPQHGNVFPQQRRRTHRSAGTCL